MCSLEELASEAAETHDIDYSAALRLVALYIAQVESVDGKTIDSDDISAEDADFLRGSIASGLENDDEAVRKLDALTEAADAYADAPHDDGRMLRSVRDQAVVAAVDACCRLSDIARAARLSRDEIDDICTR